MKVHSQAYHGGNVGNAHRWDSYLILSPERAAAVAAAAAAAAVIVVVNDDNSCVYVWSYKLGARVLTAGQ